ncbi:Spo11/DNA topoisomerase VI subunit A [Aspergillus crustosus]
MNASTDSPDADDLTQTQYDGTSTHKYVERRLEALVNQTIPPAGKAGGNPSIKLKRRQNNAGCTFFINSLSGALESVLGETKVSYSWPGQDSSEAWRFTVVVLLLCALKEAVRSGLEISTRDIYYGNPELFESQGVVNRYIEDIALTIGVERSDLNVEAAAKGLVAGCYQLISADGRIVNEFESKKECLIPRVQDIAEIDISDVKWVLILEKEAIFRRLVQSNFHIYSAAGKGILITGKGYPDIRTRAFLRKVYENILPSEPPHFYALVDGDPDGMSIMSTYKYGSMAHTRQNGRLNVPSLRWLGLRVSEVIEGLGSMGDEALIPLTQRDRLKIHQRLARNPVWAGDGPELEWRVELQRMLILNVKAETEVLYNRNGGLEGWIEGEMGCSELSAT